ncbi:MAG: type II CAAX endopeptidase family protein [Coleofasciculaceae cyanobacterium]
MTIKRVVLIILTILALFKISISLVESWNQPQIQSRLELYQTNFLLHAAEWQDNSTETTTPQQSTQDSTTPLEALIGKKPFQTAEKQYKEAIESAQKTKSKITAQLQELSSKPVAITPDVAPSDPQFAPIADSPASSEREQLQQSFAEVEQLIYEFNLRLGIIQVQQGEINSALQTWRGLSNQKTENSASSPEESSLLQTSQVLLGLWNEPARLLPNAEEKIQKNLDGWFRYRALSHLYQLQQRSDALSSLENKEQKIAQQAVFKLALIGGIPGVGGVLGVALLLFLLVQLLLQGRRSLLATNAELPWETPWNWEIIWQVLIFGFFFIGQLLLPILFGLLGVNPVNYTVRAKAFFVLLSYLLMAAGGLSVLYFSIKPFLPLTQNWFRFKLFGNWIVWGIGGYLVAVPLVILVSLINQQLWQGQGGSNPILPLALEGQDKIALLIFFVTASLAAPVFEEIIFRGFLLPSLTRYLPVWGAIAASSLLFAIAHLSLSEVLPLATLGAVLGVVYTRSRNLLAPMLLHGLWNSGTLLSLFLLGSGSN